ncbi:hypothetical protein L208DRAFT_1382632 [Tricholoma matsutake]|nr:hypothetical protein L208DRAFT_1382632 [Tricholoma matsutake 945]
MDQDPVIRTQLLCNSPLCGQPMGALRVYKGAGDPECHHLRGAICQTYITCHKTVFHTVPYKFEDAEWLLLHLNDPTNPANTIPHHLRSSSPPPTNSYPFACYTRSGARTLRQQNMYQIQVQILLQSCCASGSDDPQPTAAAPIIATTASHVSPQIDPCLTGVPGPLTRMTSADSNILFMVQLPSVAQTRPLRKAHRSLAQPLHPEWANVHSVAEQECHT